MDIGSREYDFAPMVVIVGDKARGIEVVRRGVGVDIKRREEGGWEVRVLKAREGWDERSGCMGFAPPPAPFLSRRSFRGRGSKKKWNLTNMGYCV